MNFDCVEYSRLTRAEKFALIREKVQKLDDDIDFTRERIHILLKKKQTFIDEAQRIIATLPDGPLKTTIQNRVTSYLAAQTSLQQRVW